MFDKPQAIKKIELVFDESETARTQEYLLRSSDKNGKSEEIVRQQWAFSLGATTREIEDHAVHISGATTLELTINPDISGRPVFASLASLRLACLQCFFVGCAGSSE